jgi:hypothetical protein
MKAVAPEVRFSQSYIIDDDGCWLWKLYTHKGYGRIKAYGKSVIVHRWAYSFFIGEIPEGYDIDHTCHSQSPWCNDEFCKHRRCVNPEHLEAVSRSEHGSRSRHAQKSECSRGHRFSKENTYVHGGTRFCRMCNNMRVRGEI